MSICFVWWNIMLFATTSLKLYDWVWKENFFISITYLSIVSGGTLHVCSAVFVILLVYSICINSTKWMLRDCCDNAWMWGKIWNFKPLPAKIIRHNETHIIRHLETLLDKDIRKNKMWKHFKNKFSSPWKTEKKLNNLYFHKYWQM